MATLRRAVDLGRTLRAQAGSKVRQPLARAWLALPGGTLAPGLAVEDAAQLLDLLAAELNVHEVSLLDDGSDLVERRVKVLLPVVGPRLGAKVPAVMAAAREGRVEFLAGGGVRLAGQTLSADEVEIQSVPRPGTAVGHDEGVVVVLDTTLDAALVAEGDARELARAVQDLRKAAELALDDRIELWLDLPGDVDGLRPHLPRLAAETLAASVHLRAAGSEAADGSEPAAERGTVDLSQGRAGIALRRQALDR
jgi:isoleucyl-tRNA synthetase